MYRQLVGNVRSRMPRANEVSMNTLPETASKNYRSQRVLRSLHEGLLLARGRNKCEPIC